MRKEKRWAREQTLRQKKRPKWTQRQADIQAGTKGSWFHNKFSHNFFSHKICERRRGVWRRGRLG